MKISYYPGCTLKTKARNLENSAIVSMARLGVELEELPSWNCCGAVYSLAEDDLIHQLAPVRTLSRVKEERRNQVVTLCSMCYNTLARANELMRNNEEKRTTINLFMEEEIDYHGEVEVTHLLSLLEHQIGSKAIKKEIAVPLKGLKVACYYGCTLQRPREIGIEPPGNFQLMRHLIESLGATVIDFSAADLCCGSYQVIGHPEAVRQTVSEILSRALAKGAEALALSCPLCEFNLTREQEALLRQGKISQALPIFYFTQLLAVSLGLSLESCLFELNDKACVQLLRSRNFPI